MDLFIDRSLGVKVSFHANKSLQTESKNALKNMYRTSKYIMILNLFCNILSIVELSGK